MIRIEYHDTSVLTGWNKRVKCLSSYIKDIVNNGYIGCRTKELSKRKLLQYYKTLSPFEQNVIDQRLGKAWKSKLKGKIKIPAYIVSEDVHKFFKFLNDNNQKELNDLLNVAPDKLIDKINEIDKASWGVLKDDRTKSASQRSDLFRALDAVFVEYGYGQLQNKSEFYVATNVSYCPYCNHGDVSIKRKNGKSHSVGRIDHFYCKELYPFLALTLSNLVPSCVGCNESGGKGTDDMLAKKVVLPYLLPHSHGIDFKLDLTGASSVTNEDELPDAVSIEVTYPIAELKNNNGVFALETLYNELEQKEEAIRIHQEACQYAAEPYKAYIDKTINPTGIAVPLERVFINKLGVSQHESSFANYKHSCFLMSIFRYSVDKASNGKIKLGYTY